MEYSPPRLAEIKRPGNFGSKMSTLTMPAPHHHAGFHREFAWQEPRPTELPQRSRHEVEKIALPSIRQAFPELQLRVQPDEPTRTPSSTTSPIAPAAGNVTPPEYIHSPSRNKRRRLSFEDSRDSERASQVPRLYSATGGAMVGQQSPPTAPRPAPEAWGSSSRTSPYLPSGGFSSMRSPATLEVRERVDTRPTLPSLPRMEFERNAAPMHRVRSHSGDEYMQDSMRPRIFHGTAPSAVEAPPPPYRAPGYGYSYHNNRMQSHSVGSIHHPMERASFSSGPYGHPQFHHDNFMRMSDFGMGMNGDNKQRKRRGNLPKETTDKLRAWFVAHLHHPYPTEDEKQDLMRQTGLQMNQISNWFINARRRQLPTMINNARAESDAMSGRSSDGKVLPSTERNEYDHDAKRDSVPLSDGEASNYDDVDMDGMHRRTSSHLKRGSI